MLYELSRPDEIVVGVDLFVGSPNPAEEVPTVRSNIASACGDASRLKIVVADSLQITSERVLDESGGESYRFVSIDGGHTAQVVSHALETALGSMREGGIVALDDVFNPLTPGVVEGVAAFFMGREPSLAPFAYCYNKLYATTLNITRATWPNVVRSSTRIRGCACAVHAREPGGESHQRLPPAMFGHEIFVFLG